MNRRAAKPVQVFMTKRIKKPYQMNWVVEQLHNKIIFIRLTCLLKSMSLNMLSFSP